MKIRGFYSWRLVFLAGAIVALSTTILANNWWGIMVVVLVGMQTVFLDEIIRVQTKGLSSGHYNRTTKGFMVLSAFWKIFLIAIGLVAVGQKWSIWLQVLWAVLMEVSLFNLVFSQAGEYKRAAGAVLSGRRRTPRPIVVADAPQMYVFCHEANKDTFNWEKDPGTKEEAQVKEKDDKLPLENFLDD